MSSMSSFRGGYAPRRGRGGGRGGWSKPFTKPKEYTKPDIEANPLGDLLKTFHNSDIKVETHDSRTGSAISDLQYVASYNWLNGEDHVILVPGKALYRRCLRCSANSNEANLPYGALSRIQYVSRKTVGSTTATQMLPDIRTILSHL